LQGAGFEPRRVKVPVAQLDLAAAVLDIGGVVLGEKLDLAGGALEAVMLLESGQWDLADQPRHLALLCGLHRPDDTDRLGRGRVYMYRERAHQAGGIFVLYTSSSLKPTARQKRRISSL
jgi:hypothetical protein